MAEGERAIRRLKPAVAASIVLVKQQQCCSWAGSKQLVGQVCQTGGGQSWITLCTNILCSNMSTELSELTTAASLLGIPWLDRVCRRDCELSWTLLWGGYSYTHYLFCYWPNWPDSVAYTDHSEPLLIAHMQPHLRAVCTHIPFLMRPLCLSHGHQMHGQGYPNGHPGHPGQKWTWLLAFAAQL